MNILLYLSHISSLLQHNDETKQHEARNFSISTAPPVVKKAQRDRIESGGRGAKRNYNYK